MFIRYFSGRKSNITSSISNKIMPISLLYRGYKKADEFFVDYIARISHQNGFVSPSKFKKYLRDKLKQYSDGSSSSLYAESQWRLGLELSISRNIDVDEYRRVTRSNSFLWRSTPTICNKCLESEQYIRFYWWIASYKQCHIHNVILPETKINAATELQATFNEALVHKIPELLETYLIHEECQTITLNAIENDWCILKIVNALKSYLNQDEQIGKALTDLDDFLSDRLLSNNFEDAQIHALAGFLSSRLGEYEFWVRITCLLIFNHLSGLKSNFPDSYAGARYLSASVYYLSTDKELLRYISKILDFRATHQTFDISFENLLPKKYLFSDEFTRAYRFSLYRCRTLDYFSQCLGFDKVRRIDNSIVCNGHEFSLDARRSI